MTSKTNSSDHDLIVRIDERQAAMVIQISNVGKKLDCMVPDDSDYKEMKAKVDSLWDSKNKMLGWMIGAGLTGGGIAAALQGIVKTVLAQVK